MYREEIDINAPEMMRIMLFDQISGGENMSVASVALLVLILIWVSADMHKEFVNKREKRERERREREKRERKERERMNR